MTQLDSSSGGGEVEPGVARRRYFIDPEWYERNGRLFSAFVEGRLCPSCRRKLEAERAAQGSPAATKPRPREAKRRPSNDPVAAIRSCCSKAEDFITPRLPILEAVFRLLLVKGSPMDAEQIRESLDGWAGVGGAYSHIPADTLERLLESDNFYGFRPSHSEEKGQ